MINGERIRFRAIDKEDLSSFNQWTNDPEVQQGTGIYLPFSMADEEDWFATMRKKPVDEHNLAIEVSETTSEGGEASWKLIGSCGFFNLDHRNGSSEFGIMIGEKSYWNKGYGTEAVRLLCQHGFNTLNLNRIYLRVFENNPGAVRAYEKAGFTHEGRQRQAEFRQGRYIDVLVMSMLKDEFTKSRYISSPKSRSLGFGGGQVPPGPGPIVLGGAGGKDGAALQGKSGRAFPGKRGVASGFDHRINLQPGKQGNFDFS